ncbi:MAG: hypothetical protein FJ297_17005 [Planctomycetes bacterium]|nr:hypothetical protein [Planctomycetota bacterium]
MERRAGVMSMSSARWLLGLSGLVAVSGLFAFSRAEPSAGRRSAETDRKPPAGMRRVAAARLVALSNAGITDLTSQCESAAASEGVVRCQAWLAPAARRRLRGRWAVPRAAMG